MNCVCSKQNQWANMRKSPNIGKNRAILMPSLLKTAKSADSWLPSAQRRKIQTLDQCFPNCEKHCTALAGDVALYGSAWLVYKYG